jgi:hypothetical protein
VGRDWTAPNHHKHASMSRSTKLTINQAMSLVAALLLIPSVAPARPKVRPAVEEPPLVGQPMSFSGGVGRFKIAARVSATEVRAEDPLLYTLYVSCLGPLGRAPDRPDLRKLPAFKNRFVIQDVPARDLFGARPGEHAWEFNYLLKPRSPEVTEIPPLLFAYYKPGVVPVHKGYWTTATPSIPLKVTPRSRAIVPTAGGDPLRAPERFYHITEGVAVLGNDDGLAQPRKWTITLLLLGPPLLALGWYWVWRRRYPNAARLAQIRRSRAALQALHALHAVKDAEPAARARQAAKVVDAYLRDRFALTGSAPTPAEIETHLHDVGLASARAAQVADFFRACDAACFAPAPTSENLPGAAGRLILALEGESCPSPAC